MLSGATLDDVTIEVHSDDVDEPESAKAVGNAQPPAALADHHDDELEQEGASLCPHFRLGTRTSKC